MVCMASLVLSGMCSPSLQLNLGNLPPKQKPNDIRVAQAVSISTSAKRTCTDNEQQYPRTPTRVNPSASMLTTPTLLTLQTSLLGPHTVVTMSTRLLTCVQPVELC